MVIKSFWSGQEPLVTLHSKTLGPIFKLFALVAAAVTSVIAAFPAIILQLPIPTEGTVAFKAMELVQVLSSFPAKAIDGGVSLVIETSSKDSGQAPFAAIVHLNTFAPKPNPLTRLTASFGLVIVPVPLTKVQVPVPVKAALPFNVAVSAQTLLSIPASAMVACSCRVINTTSSFTGQLPLLTVQRNSLIPIDKLLTKVPALFASVNVPFPFTKVHVPLPITGTVALNVALESQMV